MRLNAIVLATCVLAANQAWGAYYTAKTLLRQCDSDSHEAQEACRGYIAGIDDTIEAFGRWSLMRNHWCAPEGTTIEDEERAVVRYLRAHLDSLHTRAAPYVVYALMEAFPCD